MSNNTNFVSPSDPINMMTVTGSESGSGSDEAYQQYLKSMKRRSNPYNKIANKTNSTCDPLVLMKSQNGNILNDDTDNSKPYLSNMTKDLVSNKYKQYKTSRIVISSKHRNRKLYLNANCFELDLPKEYYSVYKIKIKDIRTPDDVPPINKSNNLFFWTYPTKTKTSVLGITNSIYPFLESIYDAPEILLQNRDEFYQVEIPEGYYDIDTFKEIFEEKTNAIQYNSEESFITNEDIPRNRPHFFSMDINPQTNITRIINRMDSMSVRALQTIPINVDLYGLPALKNTDVFYYYWIPEDDATVTDVSDHTEEVPYRKATDEYPYGNKYNNLNPTFIVTVDGAYKSLLGGNLNKPNNINYYPLIFTNLPSIGGLHKNNINFVQFFDINFVDSDNNTFDNTGLNEAGGITKKCVNFYRFFDTFELDNKTYVRYALYVCSSMTQIPGAFVSYEEDNQNWAYMQPSGFENIIYEESMRQVLNPGYNRTMSTSLELEEKLDLIVYASGFQTPEGLEKQPICGRATPLMFYFGGNLDKISESIQPTDNDRTILPLIGWQIPTVSDVNLSDIAPISFVQSNIHQKLESVINLDFENLDLNLVNFLPTNKIRVEYHDNKYIFKTNYLQYMRLKLSGLPTDLTESIIIAGNTSKKITGTTLLGTNNDVSEDLTDIFCAIPTNPIPLNGNYIKDLDYEKIFTDGTIDKINKIYVELLDEDGRKITSHADVYFVLEITESIDILKNSNIDSRRNDIHIER